MIVARTIEDVREAVRRMRADGERIGFVPTMGALHEGHLSLIRQAREDGCRVVVSIFVNPTQFGPGEDYEQYPRDEAGDLALCKRAGVACVFLPDVATMYPPDACTRVQVAKLTETLCGPHRPGHFDGVATVVAKLLNIVQPDAAYFGRKDAQQLAVIRRMVRDLNMPVEIIGCDTVREPDGLALSSRNRYLGDDQRRRALSLYRALCRARELIESGERDPRRVVAEMRAIVDAAEPDGVDYIEVVDPDNCQPVERIERPVLVALAVRFGPARLIDNMTLAPPGASQRSE